MSKLIVWIDQNCDSPRFKEDKKYFESNTDSKLELFKNNEDAFKYLKKIKFEDVYIIISGSLYIEFVENFKININVMNFAPKIIIFTRNKEDFLKLNPKYNSPENKFYRYGGVTVLYDEVKKFLKNDFNSSNDSKQNEPINIINPPVNYILSESEIRLTFEYIDSKEKLMLPLYFKSLIDDAKIDEVDKYTKYLYDIYSKESYSLKKLFGPIRFIPNIPIEIISKYYIRAYTSTSNFHTNINRDLGVNKIDKYITMIKTLYEGVKLSALPMANNEILFRGANISNDEIKKIKSYLFTKIDGLPGSIVFCRSFLSFSKLKTMAEYFLGQLKENEKLSKVLFILEKDDKLEYNLATHADIQEISLVPSEKEVLFFPFSSFAIKKIQFNKVKNYYEIYLLYLGKYLKIIEDDEKLIIDDKIVTESEFKKQIVESNLINKEKIQNINNKTLYNSFKSYENEIKMNKMYRTEYKPQQVILSKGDNNNSNETKTIENNERDNEIKSLLVENNQNNNPIDYNNIITGEIFIEDEQKNKNVNIINTYENVARNEDDRKEKDEFNYNNDMEIMNNLVIKINGEKIKMDLVYLYKFKEKGKYNIEYIFSNNITKTDYMFANCSCHINIDLSKFIFDNVTNTCGMFYNCQALTDIKGISNWDTKKVLDMSYMFNNCKKLKNLSDISKWDTKSVINLSNMFSSCESLNNIPDISNWNIKNVFNMNEMFAYCGLMNSIPDISKWNTINVTNMSGIFYYCKSLKIIPDISKWNTRNVTNMSLMFSNCESLNSIPDISRWNTKNVTNMNYMFYKCKNLKNKPDISKWDTTNVTNQIDMF